MGDPILLTVYSMGILCEGFLWGSYKGFYWVLTSLKGWFKGILFLFKGCLKAFYGCLTQGTSTYPGTL